MLYIVHSNLDTKWPRNDPKTRERVIYIYNLKIPTSTQGKLSKKFWGVPRDKN